MFLAIFTSSIGPAGHFSILLLSNTSYLPLGTFCSVLTGIPIKFLILILIGQDVQRTKVTATNTRLYCRILFVVFPKTFLISCELSFTYSEKQAKTASFIFLKRYTFTCY